MVFKRKFRKRLRKRGSIVSIPRKVNHFRKYNSDQILYNRVLCSATVGNSAATIVDQSASISLLYPSGWHQGTLYQQMSNVPTNLARLIGVFDQYMVTKLVVTFVPDQVDVTQSLTGSNFQPITCFMVRDYDDIALMNTGEALNDGKRARGYAAGKSISYTMSPLKSQMIWQNTSNLGPTPITAALTPGTAVNNNLVPCPCPTASVKCLWPNLPIMANAGSLFAEWHVKFRGVILAT